MKNHLFVCTAAFLLGSASLIYAQDRPPQPQNHAPVVNPDLSVTFAIELPNAKEVRLFGDINVGPRIPLLQRGDNNLWTYTTPPVEPGTYYYSFVVDGVLTPDPSSQMQRDCRSYLPWVNTVEVRSGDPLAYDPNPDIPHGTVHLEQFKSAVVGKLLPILIYTPAGYESSRKEYPVIYLIHGSGGVAQQWSSDGRMEHLADNLIASGSMPEAILVSPDANMPGNSFPAFEPYMVEEVIPFVESHYRALSSASARSIIGISRGGNQAFHVFFKRPDLFANLGVFSINLNVLDSQTYASFSDVTKLNQQIRTFVYAAGLDDGLIPISAVQKANDRLNEIGVAHIFLPVPGDHAWYTWRKLFVDFVGRL